ncbi:MAG: hypothetical protein U0794_09500 [Isosphaeraceae bacterium]
MSDPWFNPNFFSWIPGTLLGVMGGLLGSLSGFLAPQGKGRALVLGAFWTMIVIAAGLLATAVYAIYDGQPYGIWYGFGLPGVIGLILFSSLLPVISLRYREAEERKITAKDGV